MVHLGKYIRHLMAVLVSAGFTLLLDKVPAIQTYVPAESIAGAQEAVIGVLTFVGLVAWGVGYAWLEKFLKRFRPLDPEGAADRALAKEAAAVARTRGKH